MCSSSISRQLMTVVCAKLVSQCHVSKVASRGSVLMASLENAQPKFTRHYYWFHIYCCIPAKYKEYESGRFWKQKQGGRWEPITTLSRHFPSETQTMQVKFLNYVRLNQPCVHTMYKGKWHALHVYQDSARALIPSRCWQMKVLIFYFLGDSSQLLPEASGRTNSKLTVENAST